MISRRLSSGRITVAVFLVDVFCLGVKNALYTTVDPAEYAWMKGRIKSTTSLESIDPCCARKLIEGAVEYAWQFGFEPHPDYRSAKRIFGDIDSAVCATHFEYGKDGKPFYVSGPNDTPAMSERILAALERANGSEGFRYIVVAEPSREPSTF